MTEQVDVAAVVEIHETTAHLPEFERFAERIRLLFALPRTYLKSVRPLTEAQARSYAFATRPPDLEYYCWELYWAIPNRAYLACKTANEARPLGWLDALCEIILFARTDCVDTTEWIDPRHDELPLICRRKASWAKEPWRPDRMPKASLEFRTGDQPSASPRLPDSI